MFLLPTAVNRRRFFRKILRCDFRFLRSIGVRNLNMLESYDLTIPLRSNGNQALCFYCPLQLTGDGFSVKYWNVIFASYEVSVWEIWTWWIEWRKHILKIHGLEIWQEVQVNMLPTYKLLWEAYFESSCFPKFSFRFTFYNFFYFHPLKMRVELRN